MIDKLIMWLDQSLENIKETATFEFLFMNCELQLFGEDFYLCSDKGIELVLSKSHVVTSIHFFGDDTNGMPYQYDLVFNLRFYFSRVEVQKKLGKPAISEITTRNFFLGKVNSWDKFYFDNFSVQIEYFDNLERIVLITIASLSIENKLTIKLQ